MEPLDVMIINHELKDEETRKIMQAYSVFEFDRREPMYAGLEKRLPSLRYLIDEARKNKNPIESLAETRQAVTQIDSIVLMMGFLAAIDPECKKMTDELRSAKSVIENYCTFEERYFAGFAREAKNIAAGHNISPIEVVTALPYLDHVHRLVFPQRKDAESHVETRLDAAKEMVVMARSMLKLAKEDSELKKMPTEHAITQYGLATKAFEAKEFDRIYNLQFSPRTD